MQEATDSRKTLRGWTLQGKEIYSKNISKIQTAYEDSVSDPLLRWQLMIQAIDLIFAVKLVHKFIIGSNSLPEVFELFLARLPRWQSLSCRDDILDLQQNNN